jgi:hypothetical protein
MPSVSTISLSPNGGIIICSLLSKMYCSYCYGDGQFKQPDISASEMQTFVKGKLKEMGFPGFIAGFFTKGIPKLERWKK